nr:transglycosylase family protein [Actinomycetota bacterium]
MSGSSAPIRFSKRAIERARRRRRRRHLIVGAWVTAVVAGVPGASAGLGLLAPDPSEPTLQVSDIVTVEGSNPVSSSTKFRREVFEARPTPPKPTPTPEPVEAEEVAPETAPEPPAGGSVSDIIYAAAAEFGLDGGYLLSVAGCESDLDPGAVNPAGYHGLFQFDETTWGAYGYGSIYDPTAQARTAARLLAAGEASRWPNCA